MPVELWPVMRHRMEQLPRRARQVGRRRGVADELEPTPARRDRATAGASTARDLDDGLPRAQGALGLELVGDPPGPRLPLHGRRPRHRRAQQPVRGALRPARAGDPGRGARGADARRRRTPTASWCAAPRAPTASPPPAACADYYRMQQPSARAAARSPSWSRTASWSRSTVEGWKRPAYLHRDAAAAAPGRRPRPAEPVRPGGVGARAHRAALRLPLPDRDLHARAEARDGYYVLPFLLGDRIVGRVDLKADRAAGRLLVKAAYAEPGAPPETAEELAAELRPARRLARPGRRHGRAARRPGARMLRL